MNRCGSFPNWSAAPIPMANIPKTATKLAINALSGEVKKETKYLGPAIWTTIWTLLNLTYG